MAQGPRRGGPGGQPPDPQQMIEMRVNGLARRLNLTEDQKANATKIFTDALAASENARTNSRTTRESLAQAVKSNDTAAIDRLSATLGTLNGQITAIDSKAEAAFYALLTAEQKTAYDQRRPGHMGPGGQMGPGGFERGRRF